MSKVTVTGTVDAPRETVWNLLTDVGRLPEYSPAVDDVSGVPPAPLEEGTTFRTTVNEGPVQWETEWDVTTVAAPHRLVVHAGSSPLEVTVAYYLSENEDDTTDLKQVTVYELLRDRGLAGEFLDWAAFNRLLAVNQVRTVENLRSTAEREATGREIPIE